MILSESLTDITTAIETLALEVESKRNSLDGYVPNGLLRDLRRQCKLFLEHPQIKGMK